MITLIARFFGWLRLQMVAGFEQSTAGMVLM